jgi:hypothetical protein
LAEAARLGFRHALVPPESALRVSGGGANVSPPEMRVHVVPDLAAALDWLRA